METIESLLQQSSPNSCSSFATAVSPVTNFDDLIKDHHPHVLAPLQPTKYSSTSGGIPNTKIPTNAAIDFISPLPAGNCKQPPVIVGVAVKRTLRKPTAAAEGEELQDASCSSGTPSMGEILERWHSDIFDCHPPLAGTATTASDTGGDCNNNGHGNQTQIVAMMDSDGDVGDLIDFNAEIAPMAPAVDSVGGIVQVPTLKPKVKKVTFLLDDLLVGSGEEEGPEEGERSEGDEFEEDESERCVTKDATQVVAGEWDVSDPLHLRRGEGGARGATKVGGNEISTETMQTDDIVSLDADHVDGVRNVTKGNGKLRCACLSLLHGHGCLDCQHLVRLEEDASVPAVIDTALPTGSLTNTSALVAVGWMNSDTLPWGGRKIDEIPVENAWEQNACAETGNIGPGGDWSSLSVGAQTGSGSIDASRNKTNGDEGNIVDVQDVHVRERKDSRKGGSTVEEGVRVGRVVSEVPFAEPPRIDETDSNQQKQQPVVKQVENVVTSVPTGIEQLEFGSVNLPNSNQACEKSIQVPSPLHRASVGAENSGHRGVKEVHFSEKENFYHKGSDSESENYYGTCSPPPPPLVPPNGIPSSYGLNVEVTLNAHINVRGLSEFNFFSNSGDRPGEESSSSAEEKVLKDSATNTISNSGRNNNSNVTPSSADSGIIIIDDDVDECGCESVSTETQICEPLLLIAEEKPEKKSVAQCRDQDTQTFIGNFLSPKKTTSEISVQVCENGDSDLRNIDSLDSSVSESEIDERKDLRFLTKNTDQYLRPPISFLSEKHECFQASNRLKRLEERFRGFAYTKKLLRESLTSSSGGPPQNLSSSLSSLSTLLADYTNTNTASVSSSVPASSTPSLTAAARAEQEQEEQSHAGRSFVPSRKTSSLSSLQKDVFPTRTQLGHTLDPKRNVPVLPPLSSSLLSLSASSLLSLSCIDLERKQRQQQLQDPPPKRQLSPPQHNPNTPEQSLSKASSLPSLLPQYLFPSPPSRPPPRPPQLPEEPLLELVPNPPPKPLHNPTLHLDLRPSVATPESSVESEEICTIFPGGKPRIEDPLEVVETVFKDSEEEDYDIIPHIPRSESEENQEFLNLEKLLAADPYTNCEFDTRHLSQYEPNVYQIRYCYDELEEELESESGSVGGLLIGAERERAQVSVSDEDGCECLIEAVPIYRTLPIDMRETAGTLRGLLKKPNRPPPVRKNRVVFDETRNEFFDADYIILIREDCPYDEEDEEPCTCGEHELVRICCDEGCNCGYTDDGRTPPSPKFAPPIEFVDQATLSPPEGYKDGSGLLDNALGGALGGHVFGAQHIQQLQVIQRLQQQRAAMLAARAAAGQQGQQTGGGTQTSQTGTTGVSGGSAGGAGGGGGSVGSAAAGSGGAGQTPQQQQQQQTVCTECAECAECAAKQLHDEECDSQCSDDISPMMEAPLPPHATLPIALVPLQKSSPERRITQKEIIAGEERPKFLTIKQVQDASQGGDDDKSQSSSSSSSKAQTQQRYIVETITMTTVTERRIIQKTQTDSEPPPVTTTIIAVTSGNETGSTAVPPSSATAVNASDLRSLQQKQLQQQQKPGSGDATSAQQQQQPNAINSHYEIGKHKPLSTAQAISGILKGGKLWKNEHQQQTQHQLQQQHQQPKSLQQQQQQSAQQTQQQLQQQQHNQQSNQNDDSTNVTSDEETSSKRSVRFNEESTIREACCDGEVQSGLGEGEMGTGKPINYMSDTLKRHSSGLFHNALRPNSAVRQLFPSTVVHMSSTAAAAMTTATTTMSTGAMMAAVNTTNANTTAGNPTALTQEALKAFDDSKKASLVHQHSITSNCSGNNVNPSGSVANSVTGGSPGGGGGGSGGGGGAGETDTIRRTIERNALRRSLIKYEPKKKLPVKDVTSLEERIRQLTCDIDEPIDEGADGEQGHDGDLNEMERRDSPAGEENPQQPKYIPDKSFSPSSSASSSSSGSNGSTYKKITDLFHRDRRHEKIPEADENPIVIIPQDCRCPAGPDIGMGVQIQGVHTQIHQPPQQRQADSRRQFLSTLAPLTACVAGQRDDLSYYTLAQPGDRNSMGSSQCTEYSLGDIDAALHDDDGKKVAPDVIAGTPGQESDELAAFVQQEGARTERLKKRYSAETSTSAPASGAGSDDDEHNDYGFNSRPTVRGIKPRFGSTNEILQQMQAQLATPTPPQSKSQTSAAPTQPIQSNTLPRPHTANSLQLAAAKQQITTHQHTASWSYYPVESAQTKAVAAVAAAATTGTNMVTAVDPHGNYYHIPAQARHSYHGQEAIYQNCAQLPAGNIQANTVHVQSQQIHTQHHAVHTAHHIHHANQAAYGKFARSPTRRPESPPPLRNYHQTMVLIPYNAETYERYTAQEQENYRRQHNIVEYQQVTQQTIRVPVGYPLPGMQLHVVAGRGALPPHYSTLPRLGSSSSASSVANAPTGTIPNASQGKPPAYTQYPVDKGGVKFTERGAPEGAASVQPSDVNSLLSPTSQGHGPPTQAVGPPASSANAIQSGGNTAQNTAAQGQGAVFYAMNV
ncbi:uncharacterized protein LOC5567265 isoform X3 [Aedes aegypti]|uniref:Uncharacterized protein n=1 Tax=Aedes aegypti TaxID=7159 RepID=A0A6I8U871_AEDAE|nr:uncharacterized protein LOC5567265 isoform X3 [Aedes aegypti]